MLCNIGPIIYFRLGLRDTGFMEKEFNGELKCGDFLNLPKYHIYLKLLIDGTESKEFSAVTLDLF
ncbi:MAG: hypothetical protein ACXVAY_07005 [Mucilaginibacter sp.]